MDDIFISYAREDRPRAEEFAKIFEDQNWSVWWDRELDPGDLVDDTITGQLATAKAVVVLWSKHSVNSVWVKDEAQEALDRNVIVPVLIDEKSIPIGFRQFQAANLTGWDGSPAHIELRLLLQKIGKLIEKPVVAREPTAVERVKYFIRRHAAAILVGAVALSLLAGVVAYQNWPRKKLIDENRNLSGGGNDNRAPEEEQRREREARDTALQYTAEGLRVAADGNYEGALLFYEQAIGASPKYPNAYFHRGQSYVTLRRDDLAIADFRTFMNLVSDPGNPNLKDAEVYLARLVRPREVNPHAGTQAQGSPGSTVPTVGSNGGTPANTSAQLAPAAPAAAPAAPLIEQMFSDDKATRIAATTRLILERKQDESVVTPAVQKAESNPDNKSGVINVLVLIQSMPPEIVRRHRGELERLFARVQGNGKQTADHIEKLRKVLRG